MQNVPNQNLAIYFREKNNRSLAPPLRSSIINRTPDSRRSTFKNGATAVNFMFPSVSATISQKMVITDPVRAPTDPDAQKLTIPNMSPLEDDLTIPIYTSASVHYNGLFNGTTYDSVTTDPTFPTSAGPVPQGTGTGFLKSHADIVDGNFVALPEGMVLGAKSLVTGSTMNVGQFAVDNFDTTVLSAGGFRYRGTSGVNGPVNEWRPFSALVLGTGGITSGSGFAVADAVAALNLINVGPLITVNPPSNNVTASMKFTILSGAKWIGDDVLQDKATGKYLNIIESELSDGSMVDYVDTTTGNFKKNFILDLSLVRITQNFNIQASAPGVNTLSFLPGTLFDTSFDISGVVTATTGTDSYAAFSAAYNAGLLDLVFPTGTGSGISMESVVDEDGDTVLTTVPNYTDRNNVLFATELTLPTGTTYPIPLLSKDGMQFPKGFIVTQLSSVSSLPEANVTAASLKARKVFSAPYAILDENSFIFNDTKMISIIGTSEMSEVPEGSITTIPQSFLPSSSWPVPAILSDVVLASGHSAQSYIKFLTGQVVGSEMSLPDDSLIKANSVLPPGLITRAGMRSDKDIDFPAGTPIDFVLDLLNTPINIQELTNINRLVSGTLIRAIGSVGDSDPLRTILPNGFVLSNGNRYPANVRIYATENVLLNPGSVLEDPVFGPNFVLTQTHLESGFVFTASTTLGTGVSLPSGTLIEAGNKFPFPLPLPRDHVFPAGSKLPVGLNFAAGSRLPGISMRPQEDALRVAAQAQSGANLPGYVNNVPYLTVTIGGKLYLVLAKNTVMNRNSTLPKGAVMLAANGFTGDNSGSIRVGAGPGYVTTPTSAVYSDGAWVPGDTNVYTIDEAEFSYTQGPGLGVSIGPFSFDIGVPTTNPIILKGELRLPFDVAFPFSDNNETMRTLTFAVDFVISREVTISQEVIVDDDGSVLVPTDLPLPWDVTLTSEFILPNAVTLLKRITLPSSDVSDYIENILSVPNSFIRLPGHITSPGKKIKVSPLSDGLYISTTTTGTKAFIEVKRGTKVDVSNHTDDSYDGYRLRAPLPLSEDWLVEEDVVSSPPFVVAGIRLAAGSLLPGEISVGNTTPFPGGLMTNIEIVLIEDFAVTNPNGTPLIIPEGAFMETNSIVARDSVFSSGCELTNVEYGPVSFWNDGGKMYVYQGQSLPTPLTYNYFSNTVPYSVVQDVSSLRDSISDLSNMVALQQSSLTFAQANISTLNAQVTTMSATQATQAASISSLTARVAQLEAIVGQTSSA